MRVLLLRADGRSANLGVRALREGTETLVKRAFGEETVVHAQNFDGGDTGAAFNRRAVAKDFLRPNGPIKSVLREYDVVIDVCGGDSFTDIYGMKRLALVLYTQRTSQRLGLPTILGPQTIGPFERSFSRRLAAGSLRRMSLVFSRDHASTSEAAALGRPVDLAATDVVFALPDPQQENRKGVIVNVSGLLWNDNRHVDSGRYRADIRSLIEGLLADGRSVSLLAHVLDSSSHDNDVPAVRSLAEEYGGHVTTIIPASLADARREIAASELVIGSRMHACLNALSTGTPAIPWAYSRKFAPLLEDVGWTHLVNLRSEASPPAATHAILDAYSAETLLAQAEQVRTTAVSQLELVVSALAEIGQKA